MRKTISKVLILCLLITVLIPATIGFADSEDVKTAFEELNALEDKAVVLSKLFDVALEGFSDGEEASAQDIYDALKEALTDVDGTNIWDIAVTASGVPGDGKVSEASVMVVCQKIVNNKSIIIDYYDTFEEFLDESIIKTYFLGLPEDATAGEVFVALTERADKVVTRSSASSNEFVANGSLESKIEDEFGTNINP